jgi:glycosyltransferase involved in cell wall biosynthesis
MLVTGLERGGAETQAALLAVELRRRGWAASVVALGGPGVLSSELDRAGIPVFHAGLKPGATAPAGVARLAMLLHRLRPRVLHAHLFHANLAARLLRLALPAPVVISTVHSLAETGRNFRSAAARDRLYRLTGCLADTTVFVSRAAADRHIVSGAAAPGSVRVIPNGIDTARFRPDLELRARLRAELGLTGARFTWLAAGRLLWKKDYPTMLRAIARAGSDTLLIAGSGPDEAALRRLAGELRIDARFLGARDDVPALMNAADGFVLSSVTEGLPLALLEAAASGLPAVATAAGGAAEAVVDGVTGFLCPPGDDAALAAAMARVAGMAGEARAAMGRAAREHALANFDIRLTAGEWDRLYRELLETAARRSLEWM